MALMSIARRSLDPRQLLLQPRIQWRQRRRCLILLHRRPRVSLCHGRRRPRLVCGRLQPHGVQPQQQHPRRAQGQAAGVHAFGRSALGVRCSGTLRREGGFSFGVAPSPCPPVALSPCRPLFPLRVSVPPCWIFSHLRSAQRSALPPNRAAPRTAARFPARTRSNRRDCAPSRPLARQRCREQPVGGPRR